MHVGRLFTGLLDFVFLLFPCLVSLCGHGTGNICVRSFQWFSLETWNTSIGWINNLACLSSFWVQLMMIGCNERLHCVLAVDRMLHRNWTSFAFPMDCTRLCYGCCRGQCRFDDWTCFFDFLSKALIITWIILRILENNRMINAFEFQFKDVQIFVPSLGIPNLISFTKEFLT